MVLGVLIERTPASVLIDVFFSAGGWGTGGGRLGYEFSCTFSTGATGDGDPRSVGGATIAGGADIKYQP